MIDRLTFNDIYDLLLYTNDFWSTRQLRRLPPEKYNAKKSK